nr:cobalt ABC transporter permease [uncultured Cohaesibacter sp.]
MNKLVKVLASFLLLFACTFAIPASAHKVVVSAYADGNDVEGEIGFSNGDMAVKTEVEVYDDAGTLLGKTMTDEDGIFRYTPTKKEPITFRANLGAGHIATYRLGVDELPDSIGGDAVASEAAAEVENVVEQLKVKSDGAPDPAAVGLDPAALQKLIAAEVHEQLEAFKPDLQDAMWQKVKPLRKVLFEYMEKNDMQAILGGIGYICGLFGIGFYVAARKDRKRLKELSEKNA